MRRPLAIIAGLRRKGNAKKAGSVAQPMVMSSGVLDAAIEAAEILVRSADDNGPRVAILIPALGGSFYFSGEEASERIRKHFPHLATEGVQRAVRYLGDRVKIASRPTPDIRRKTGWVHGWREQG